MPDNPVILIDTSVLLHLLEVPGKGDRHAEVEEEFNRLVCDEDAQFIIPITSIIETGNHVEQSSGDRYKTAQRFCKLIEAALGQDPPWIIRDVAWDTSYLQAMLDGDSTGTDLHSHLSNSVLGAGDVSILVERDRFLQETAYSDVRVWTYDDLLRAHS